VRGPVERAFVIALREALLRGEEPSARKVFETLIERGESTRDPRSMKSYGPGARYTRLCRVATQEWYDHILGRST